MVRCFYDQNEFKISPSTEFLHTDIPSFDFLKRVSGLLNSFIIVMIQSMILNFSPCFFSFPKKRSSTKEAIKSLDASQKGDDSDIDDMESCKRGSRNKEMSKAFLDLSKLYQQCSLDRFDTWKAYSFAVISGRLRHLDFEIATLDDCKKLAVIPGFGPSTREMVKQFLVTGEIQRTKALLASEERQAMIALTNIWGVGMATVSYKRVIYVHTATIVHPLRYLMISLCPFLINRQNS